MRVKVNIKDKGPNIRQKGKPATSSMGIINSGPIEVNDNTFSNDNEMAEKYTEGQNEKLSENVNVRHPNRNLSKPDIDKPPYN
jgi:hypothetical protein